MAHSTAPSALKLFDAFPTLRSRTGLLNAAASRLVEWFHLTTQEISPEKQELEGLLRGQVLQYLRINLRVENFSMLSHSPLLRTLAAGFAVVLGLGFAATDRAQSGRRARTSPPPAPAATPEPTPTATPASSEKPKPRFTFLVGLDRHDGFSNVPPYAYDGALRSLVDRLDDSPVVHVSGTQSDMNRADAVQKAKLEKEGYVVWLQLEVDTMSSNTQNSRTPDMVIQYLVLAPTTAKPVTSGRTYTQAQRNRGGILNPRTSSIYGDRYLNLAAEEAADKILAYFRSHGPAPSPPIKKP